MSDDEDSRRWAYLAEGNAKQARKRVAAKVLVRDVQGRVLLVNPNYKPHWDLPGGMAEANESPQDAAHRECSEELSARIDVGRLLLLDWEAPHGPWDDQLVLVFDGGVLDAPTARGLHVTDAELTDLAFLPQRAAITRLRPDVGERLRRSLHALATHDTLYFEHR